MIKTTTKHTVTVKASELKKNLYGSFMQLLQDELDGAENDFEYFQMDLNRMQDEVDSIEKNGFAQSFRDGYTMMLLNDKDFTFVDEWFNKTGYAEEELVVRIVDHLGNQIEVVPSVDLSY
jgi:hypothetical protein